MNANLTASTRWTYRDLGRRRNVYAALLATAVCAFAASAEAESLHEAAEKGDVAEVTRLLDRGADPNVPDAWGQTPLLHAAALGHVEVARLLLDRGADIEARSSVRGRKGGVTSLLAAAHGGHREVVTLLLDQGAYPDAPDANGKTPLASAVMPALNVEIVRLLLDAGADPNARDGFGNTPLSRADLKLYMSPSEDVIDILPVIEALLRERSE